MHAPMRVCRSLPVRLDGQPPVRLAEHFSSIHKGRRISNVKLEISGEDVTLSAGKRNNVAD